MLRMLLMAVAMKMVMIALPCAPCRFGVQPSELVPLAPSLPGLVPDELEAHSHPGLVLPVVSSQSPGEKCRLWR